MTFVSTRGFSDPSLDFSDVILQGLAPDGGLFLPTEFPTIDSVFLESLLPLSYTQQAFKILSLFDLGFSDVDLKNAIEKAYSSFSSPLIAPIQILNDKNAILELFHGPTASFKDMALQLTPQLFHLAQQKKGSSQKYAVLTATSGDTGIAAIEGFKKIPNVSVVVLYPKGKVSALQEMQMRSITDKNVLVIAVESDFDFCQTSVKQLFADTELLQTLETQNIRFTAANSMNWGRLLPQVVYYFSAYAQLVNAKKITLGEKIEVCVPCGNFGNLLAAYIAAQMGLPIEKFIVASNENNVLSEFFQIGEYSIYNKKLISTDSPSIDILISSNIERFLYLFSHKNAQEISGYFSQLSSKGTFSISPEMLTTIQKSFSSGYAVREEMQSQITSVLEEHDYLLDPHTAVAVAVGKRILSSYFRLTVSTAHPQKFVPAMASVFQEEELSLCDAFASLGEKSKMVKTHASLKNILNSTPVQNTTCPQDFSLLKNKIQQFLVK